ncbi:MAG TPA: tRNA uridine-5-carboxymethylaminomethyl(34) synthesis GTPase MnmE, partial [Rhodoplanes sp.]|nr:tRNA uridine-5-carboxymethylaminomethyl(34) synthesis GTPase MnmE [Rhodoplanes sp.]
VLGRIAHCRPAAPGEFTRRAFANGKLDLTRVEGLADLIAADTEAQRRQAFRQLRGWLGDRAEAWRTGLIGALALVEARIDFADEGDVPDDLISPALAAARTLRDEIAAALGDERRGERLREGLVVAIAGPPNAGKSSLINRIARREAAIVSPYAGTTRDIIEVHLDLGGAAVTLLDTAGIRESDDPVEQEGVRRARARAAGADLVLWIIDASVAGEGAASSAPADVSKAPIWTVRNKIDLVGERVNQSETIPTSEISASDARHSFAMSAHTGAGLAELLAALERFAAEFLGSAEPVLITRERHRLALQETLAALDRALAEPPINREEIVAEEMRLAARALGRLVGRVDVEDILDVIFRDFCIGK